MWKKKGFNNSTSDAAGSSFFSSGFYGVGDDDSETPSRVSMLSASGVLPPSESVAATRAAKVNDGLIRLVSSLQSSQQFDAMRLTLKLSDWEILAQHLQTFSVEPGQEVLRQGATEVTVYMVESGTLNVCQDDANGKVLLATVGAGSVIGEGAFFARVPRNATVQAASRCVLWALSPMRFAELAHRHPSIALSFVMALGSVVTRRMTNQRKRGAVT